MIVADTNLMAYFLMNGDFTSEAEAVYRADSDWVAPYLWRSEFRNILALYLGQHGSGICPLTRGISSRQNLISLEEAEEIINQAELLLSGKECEVDSHSVLKLVHGSGLSAYDCEYIALAQDLNIRLVTSNLKIIKAFPAIAVSPKNFR